MGRDERRVAHHGVQRRADVVGHIREERVFRHVGGLGLGKGVAQHGTVLEFAGIGLAQLGVHRLQLVGPLAQLVRGVVDEHVEELARVQRDVVAVVLYPTHRAVAADDAADPVNHVEQPRVQHGDLVDDEDVGFLQLAFAACANGFDQIVGQCRGQADAAPGMDGGAVDMRGSDARGCGDGHGCAVGTRLPYEFVEHVGFAGTGRARQEHACAGTQNRKRLGLPHYATFFTSPRPMQRNRQATSLSTTLSTPCSTFDGAM